MKLVGYCRVSTENQEKEGTIEIQRQALTEWAAKNDHELEQIFTDDGISGSKGIENRPGLASVFEVLEKSKAVDGVVVYKMDRFARDLKLQDYLLYRLENIAKKKVISITEPESDKGEADPFRDGFKMFLGLLAQMERQFIKMRMTGGRTHKAHKGGYAGGRAAIGYKAEGKDLKYDEAGVETVKTIYELRSQGRSLRAIVAELNAQQIPTASGGKWYAGTVKYILDNPVYKGTLHYKGIENNRPDLQIAA